MELNDILIESVMSKERTPDELEGWVQMVQAQFRQDEKLRKSARLREGLTKKFYEEICPLSLFASKLFGGRKDILCCPNLGNENYDAVVVDLSAGLRNETKIEITVTRSFEKHLRMEYLNEHGHVWLTGNMEFEGNKRSGHKITIKPKAVDHEDTVQRELDLIQQRAKKKISKDYSPEHILLIGFDDSIGFYNPGDRDFLLLNALAEMMREKLMTVFQSVYFVGNAGRVMLVV